MSRIRRLPLVAVLLLAATAVAQERHLYNVPLRYALPEQVVPALRPLLSEGSSLSHFNNQLILNATPEEHRQLLQLLQQLDASPRALLISVRKQGEWNSQHRQVAVDGRYGNDQVQIRTGRPVGDGTRVRVEQRDRTGSVDGTQQVRATEGMAAFINTGTRAPLVMGRYPHGGEYRERVAADSGFYASARVVDGEVIVDIDQRDDRLRGGTVQSQGLQTQVRGRLGQWIPLGGVSQSRSGSERGLSGYGDSAGGSLSDLAIKVDVVQ